MKRRLNYTGRKRIVSAHFHAQVSDSEIPSVIIMTTLDDLGLPGDARVIAEPHIGTMAHRIDLGSVSERTASTQHDLSVLGDPAQIRFRVKVTNADGRILAQGDGIPLKGRGEDGAVRSLVHVSLTDLGEEIWQLGELESTDVPRLLLNRNIPGIEARLANDPLLQGSILVPIVRQILSFLAGQYDPEDPWHQHWETWFVKTSGGQSLADLDSDQNRLGTKADIDAACSEFARQLQFASRVAKAAEPDT